jgi:glutamate/tyrosine decarboxylase-like PLP-dependent enzyme
VDALRERTRRIAAWFLGPKAENAALEEELILYILRDYFHWRRNYQPSDEIIVTQQMRRDSVEFSDALLQQLAEMLARLKRHFPFYSPRYIAHMLSDQTIPAILGYFAGMLYNPNNVTPESSPVTLEWELGVAADILHLAGYQPPPPPGASHRDTRREFGWAHITSGGTVANIEALWVARNVRYFPLAARRVARDLGLPLTVKLAADTAHAALLAETTEAEALGIRPNEAVFLLPRLVAAVRDRFGLSTAAEATARTWELISATGASVAHHGARAFADHPPCVFVSSAAHYSLTKAADVLGIGRDGIVFVDVDRRFRIDLRDLEAKIWRSLDEGRLPLAVAAIAGTTEEGAVDPIHEIDTFRRKLEAERGASFWLHVDAAWGGYFRSLFVTAGDNAPEATDIAERLAEVQQFASREVMIERGVYRRIIPVRWGHHDTAAAFLAFPRAESIAIDPHKLGYVPYPCGVVAFRNDRVRHFLAQEALYLDESETSVPRYGYQPTRTIGPYILEGSKPGAAAAACWLSHRTIPPDREGYGEILRASLLAARELFERLNHFDHAARANGVDAPFEFLSVTPQPPDTNVVCFLAKRKGDSSLARMNLVGAALYERFTIAGDGGASHDYSYLQPFFLSHTRFRAPHYSPHSVGDLLARAQVDARDYASEGIFVLRATVMSPYIVLAQESGGRQVYLAEFVDELARVTAEIVRA